MESAMLRTLVEVESGPGALPQAPKRVVSRTYPGVPQLDSIELDSLRRPQYDANKSTPATPREERDLEMSAPGTPAEPADAVSVLPSWTDPPKNKYRLVTCCMQNFLGGLNDAAAGALIPYMEKYYNIGYAVVSLIFIGNALGFIVAAPFVDQIRLALGRSRTLGLSSLCMALGYTPFIAAAPFPAVVIGYFFFGFGMAVQLAIGNVFCANLQRGTTMLGAMHGSYGLGGTLGPLIATAIVSSGRLWSRYYLLTLSFALVNAAFATWAFAGYEKEVGPEVSRLTRTASGRPPRARQQVSAMFGAFRSKVVLLGAIFIFAYQGAEVSISGWVISFLIATRDGRPERVGYATAGFWGGITLGRFGLSPLGARVGEKRFVYAIVGGAALFQLLVWFIPNVVGDAVSLAIVGLLLGPVYPCAAVIFTRNLSRQEQVSGLGLISAFGSSGGAVAPFITGALAQVAGTFVLHPIAIGLFAVMVVSWYGQPARPRRAE
ncbi:major facilitator superfamily domain-containing protein [Xylariomycetidae sp. FL0641]|nr:major facilitator superfamily domain-containing protein [Xylariomycetidae sp. FL0641]